jgi:tetratricopeptide (TPR) repeat protein
MLMNDSDLVRVSFGQLWGYYFNDNDFDGAENVLKKWLPLRKSSELESIMAYDCMKVLIAHWQQDKQFEKAKSWSRRLMDIKTVSLARQAAARAHYANSFRCANQDREAVPLFEASVSELRQIVGSKPSDESCQALAEALWQYSASQFNLKRYDEALGLNAEGIKLMEGPHVSIFILEGLVHERYNFMSALNRSAEAAVLKERLEKLRAKREAVQREQLAEAARRAKSAE